MRISNSVPHLNVDVAFFHEFKSIRNMAAIPFDAKNDAQAAADVFGEFDQPVWQHHQRLIYPTNKRWDYCSPEAVKNQISR